MVVDQVDIASGVRLLVIGEYQPPISRDGQASKALQTALERVQFPAGKPVNLVEAVRRFQREQELAQLVGHRAGHTFGIVVIMQGLKSFVAKTGLIARATFLDYVRYDRTRSSCVIRLTEALSFRGREGPIGFNAAEVIRA